jgi:hypothetical protein
MVIKKDSKMQETVDKPMYAIRDVPGKGKGIVATENIPKGTRILCEEPLIISPRRAPNEEWLQENVQQQVESLTKNQRDSFLNLDNIYPYKGVTEQYYGIVKTNAYSIENQGTQAAVFLEAARINHACDRNAMKHWNENISRLTFHALRNISKDEEITVYYLPMEMSRELRQETLKKQFKFTCVCGLCSLPEEQSLQNDQRLAEIGHLNGLIAQDHEMNNLTLQTLRYVDRQVCLFEEQGPIGVGLARAYSDATRIVITNGDLARGRIFANRAVAGWCTIHGSDSKSVIDYENITRDPSKCYLYGKSMKWRTTVDEVPQEFEPSVFEDWLWKRKKSKLPKLQQLGQLADMRNQKNFPSFTDLPNENDFDPDYYKSDTRKLRRHWCFLGEIVEFIMLTRLQMEIKDVYDSSVELFFHTERKGNELAPSKVRKGYTVAILYAHQHPFAFGEPGIRHEDPQLIRVIPVPMYKLDLCLLTDDASVDFSSVTTQVAGVDRPSSKAVRIDRRNQNVSRVR